MKSAYETPEVKAVTAAALLWEGKHAGNIVSRRAAKSGGVTATLSIWLGPWLTGAGVSSYAGGGGYDKVSAAIADAALLLSEDHPCRIALQHTGGRGWSAVQTAFALAGYRVVEVIS